MSEKVLGFWNVGVMPMIYHVKKYTTQTLQKHSESAGKHLQQMQESRKSNRHAFASQEELKGELMTVTTLTTKTRIVVVAQVRIAINI